MNLKEIIEEVSARMSGMKNRSDLAEYIAEEILKFSMHDLQLIGARVRYETELLPDSYRKKFRPYAEKWFFGRYHNLIKSYRSGEFKNLNGLLKDPETFREYCRMIPKGCFVKDNEVPKFVPEEKEPLYALFYYLLVAYAMFVIDEPGHPLGTPFPGGSAVIRKDDGYYCPIRDKEEEIFQSVCNFCPALQDPDFL